MISECCTYLSSKFCSVFVALLHYTNTIIVTSLFILPITGEERQWYNAKTNQTEVMSSKPLIRGKDVVHDSEMFNIMGIDDDREEQTQSVIRSVLDELLT